MNTYIADSLDGKIYYAAQTGGKWYIFLSEAEGAFKTRLIPTAGAWLALSSDKLLDMLEGFKELANKLEDFEGKLGDFKIDKHVQADAPEWLALDDYKTEDVPCLHVPSGRVVKMTPLEGGLSMAEGDKDFLDAAQAFYLEYVKSMEK